MIGIAAHELSYEQSRTFARHFALVNGGVDKGTFGTFGTAKSLALDEILG